MKALITGSRGTVGMSLCSALRRDGWHVTGWDRTQVANTNYTEMKCFIEAESPDVLIHLAAASQPSNPPPGVDEGWLVNYEWTSELAWITQLLNIRFVFTSTAMVFTDKQPGPYTIASPPDASEGYGLHKKLAEAQAFKQNPNTRVVRLGWQIGDNTEGNQMTAWLHQRESVEASVRWIPACSHLEDTATALIKVCRQPPGIYQLNANEGWSFFDLAVALRTRHGMDVRVQPSFDWAYDQRMLDPRIPMPRLTERLPELKPNP